MRWIGLMIALVCGGGAALAEDWPQLRGPYRNGTTSEKVAVWKEAPRVLWRKRVNEGNSIPVIAEGRLFLHCKVADKEEEELLALDAVTGKVLWRKSYPRRPFTSNTGNGPRAAPAVALGRVYTHGVTGILTCYAADTGKQLWQIDTHKKFNVPPLKYGAVSSPLVEGNRLLVNIGAPGASIVAFDAETGRTAWKALDDPVSTSAPTLLLGEDGRRRQVVFQTALRLAAVNPADGSILWQRKLSDTPIDSAPALTSLHGDLLFACSIHYGGIALRAQRRDERWRAATAWHNEALGAYFPNAVPVGKEHFYLVTNTSKPGVVLRCIELKTGKELWNRPGVGDWHAGLIAAADDKILLHDGQGDLRLLAHDPKGYRELARARVGVPATLTNPALANGRLYLRDLQEVVCVQLGK